MILFVLGFMLICPIIALFLNCFLVSQPRLAAQLAGKLIGISFLTAISLLCYFFIFQKTALGWSIKLNTLNLLLSSLILFISFIVHQFSLRYMLGDRFYKHFFTLLSALTLSVLFLMLADNLFLFWGAWSISNVLLVRLMIHKSQWQAAKNSGVLALYNLGLGCICLLVAFILLSRCCTTNSIEAIINQPNFTDVSLLFLSMSLILIAALTQSALFPFHRWLISSLNSPTPASALMHAGLINGGGILIVKFAPLMILQPILLNVLFLLGALSAFLGTVWKLMQHDIKKMLACSTLAQMGFMMMQCGVGLFAAAIAHLCWHGLFKAYLFLSAGSAATQHPAVINSSKITPTLLIISLLGGLMAMSTFAFITHKPYSILAPTTFILFFAFIAGAQLLLTWICSHKTIGSLITGLILAAFTGLMYGTSIHLIELLLPSASIVPEFQLSFLHWTVMMLFGGLWIGFNLRQYKSFWQSKFGCWLYMNLFNASQPSAKTITTVRSDYKY
ncbi:proton-conducting transporter membrane subunit [Legionella sp. D16C41]|uniref:proton-conducting transporter transmembrane domain-containing protein n=1 Tax=Legionella sp. D16C41 TaxID=3402688 RepID=UPI003AF76260